MSGIDFLVSFLYFFIFSNIILLFLLNFKLRPLKANQILLALFSYGSAPILVGIIFNYSIFLCPQKEDWFYLLIILMFFFLLLSSSFKNFSGWLRIYKNAYYWLKNNFLKNTKFKLFVFLIAIILSFFGAQAVFYPAVGDQAVYIHQGKAIYESKTDVRKNKIIQTENKNQAIYNPAVRPGVPYYYASTMLFRSSNSYNNYFLENIYSFYYYVLLFILFLYAIYFKRKNLSLFLLAAIIFLFFWALSRVAIFNTKEASIYFFTLLSLILLYFIFNKKEKRDFSLEILLGIVSGFNVLINVHGMVILAILALIFFIFEKRPFRFKLIQFSIIFLLMLIFSAFEFLIMFKVIFISGMTTIRIFQPFVRFIRNICSNTFHISCFTPQVIQEGSYFGLQDAIHKNLYNIHSLKDLYLKGKLQIFTNVGYYAFSGWIFLITIFLYIKKILANNFQKIILIFIGLYFLIIIDPLALNKHPSVIVLSASPYYATLLVFLGMTIFIDYLPDLLNRIINFFLQYRKIFSWLLLVLLILLFIFRKQIINNLIIPRLNLIATLYKNLEFYQNKIIFAYQAFLVFIFLVTFLIFLSKYLKDKSAYLLKLLIILVFFVFPFFLFEPGKIPLRSTFTNIRKDQEYKLRHILVNSDYFNTFYDAQKILPPNTKIGSENYDILNYNNYFQLLTNNPAERVAYKISSQCDTQAEKILLKNGNIFLCEVK